MAQSISEATVKISAELVKDVAKVTRILFTQVLLDTPVDTGRARGNWQPSETTPAGGTVATLDKTGGSVIAKVDNKIKKPGLYYFTNNLPYAAVLEYGRFKGSGPKITSAGFSTQAPQGMVRKNVKRIQSILNKVSRT